MPNGQSNEGQNYLRNIINIQNGYLFSELAKNCIPNTGINNTGLPDEADTDNKQAIPVTTQTTNGLDEDQTSSLKVPNLCDNIIIKDIYNSCRNSNMINTINNNLENTQIINRNLYNRISDIEVEYYNEQIDLIDIEQNYIRRTLIKICEKKNNKKHIFQNSINDELKQIIFEEYYFKQQYKNLNKMRTIYESKIEQLINNH